MTFYAAMCCSMNLNLILSLYFGFNLVTVIDPKLALYVINLSNMSILCYELILIYQKRKTLSKYRGKCSKFILAATAIYDAFKENDILLDLIFLNDLKSN